MPGSKSRLLHSDSLAVDGPLISRMLCPFCKIDRSDQNASFIFSMDQGALYLNENQSYRGRCLYIPFEHYEALDEIPQDIFISFNLEINFIATNLKKLLKADLINIAMLGNKVRHIHWHLIPRYRTDQNWGSAPWPNVERKLDSKAMLQLKSQIKTQLIKNAPHQLSPKSRLHK